GIDLSDAEVAAFLEMDTGLWARMAKHIDARLLPAWPAQGARAASQKTSRSLTERERHVLRGVFEGRTNKQIGIAIGVSESAVKATLQQLFRKTQVRTRAQLVRAIVDGSLGAPISG